VPSWITPHPTAPPLRSGSATFSHKWRREARPPPPRCPSALAIEKSGKTGGRKLAHLKFMCDLAAARPAISVPACSAAPRFSRGFAAATVATASPRSGRGLCASFRHAGVIVPPGEPLGRTSPATRLRQPRDGGADPFPPTRRRDRASRRKGLGQDKGGAKGVDKIFVKGAPPLSLSLRERKRSQHPSRSEAEAKC